MIYKVFTVFDVVGNAYLQPFFMTTTGQAIRGFSDVVNDPSHQFNKHPNDYYLCELGTFDDSIASLVTYPEIVRIGCAREYWRSSNSIKELNSVNELGSNQDLAV